MANYLRTPETVKAIFPYKENDANLDTVAKDFPVFAYPQEGVHSVRGTSLGSCPCEQDTCESCSLVVPPSGWLHENAASFPFIAYVKRTSTLM